MYIHGGISVKRIYCHFCWAFGYNADQKRWEQSGRKSRSIVESGAEQDAKRRNIDRYAEPIDDLRASHKYAV